MNKKIKLITLLLTLIFCVSAMSFTVSAVNTNDGVVTATEAPPVEDEPIVEPEPDPVPENPTYAPEQPEEPPVSSDTNSYVSSNTEHDYSSHYSSSEITSNYSSSYVSEYSSNYNNEPEPTYVNPESDVQNQAPASTYNKNDMYKNAGKVDVDELSDSDWDSIAKGLADAESMDTGGDDFNFIKKNNSSLDNGIWMLITGAVLVILSILGLSYVIITSKKAKRNLAFAGGKKHNGGSRSAEYKPNRASNDYGDGYSASKNVYRKPSKRLEDTSDIYLPKSMKNGGNRFKH